MTLEEQRIAIAEDQGWKIDIHDPFGDVHWHKGTELAYESELPDYPNDLNAMRLVEYSLLSEAEPNDAYKAYINELCGVIYRQLMPQQKQQWHDCEKFQLWLVATATAKERAEAYLRFKGLWKD